MVSGGQIAILLTLTPVLLLASAQAPDVYEFCTAVLQDHGARANACEMGCQGAPGKRGPVGGSGPPGAQGPRGEQGTCMHLENEVGKLKKDLKVLMSLLRESKDGFICYSGLKDKTLPDSAFSSSENYNSDHAPQYGRLDRREKAGAWCVRNNRVGHWFQVDFGSPKYISGIITQGRTEHAQWVTSYKFACGLTEEEMETVAENGAEKVFQANSDRTTHVVNMLPTPLTCRYARIYPTAWSGYICMRAEFIKGDCKEFFHAAD